MRINTAPATETPKGTATTDELDLMHFLFPNVKDFDFPTPYNVASSFITWFHANQSYAQNFITKGDPFYVFLTGYKQKGQGIAILSYETTYKNAILPLLALNDIKDDHEAVQQYLINNPICVKKYQYLDYYSPDYYENIDKYVLKSFSLLNMWINNPNFPAYQHITEPLNALYFSVKDAYINGTTTNGTRTRMHIVPQKPTTSRGLISNERAIQRINVGYRFNDGIDPFDGHRTRILELVTWFFADSRATRYLFKDYFDVDATDVQRAVAEMRKSPLYEWAYSMTPEQYANSCNIYRVNDFDMDKELSGLTLVSGSINH